MLQQTRFCAGPHGALRPPERNEKYVVPSSAVRSVRDGGFQLFAKRFETPQDLLRDRLTTCPTWPDRPHDVQRPNRDFPPGAGRRGGQPNRIRRPLQPHPSGRLPSSGGPADRNRFERRRTHRAAATEAGADCIMVTSWNEWPETTVVEPSSSWPDPYLYLKILAEWKGVAFTPPPLPGASK